jgi:hypothetical protein
VKPFQAAGVRQACGGRRDRKAERKKIAAALWLRSVTRLWTLASPLPGARWSPQGNADHSAGESEAEGFLSETETDIAVAIGSIRSPDGCRWGSTRPGGSRSEI